MRQDIEDMKEQTRKNIEEYLDPFKRKMVFLDTDYENFLMIYSC